MTTHTTPTAACPACGYETDRASNAGTDSDQPKPGDISLCFRCGAINTFTPGLGLEAQDLDLLPPRVKREALSLQSQIRYFRLVKEAPL